jgi:hypothetical protein
MPVQIDELSAEVAPSAPESAPAPPARPGDSPPEAEWPRQHDLLARLEARAARIRAD